jgi:hypothetical protein
VPGENRQEKFAEESLSPSDKRFWRTERMAMAAAAAKMSEMVAPGPARSARRILKAMQQHDLPSFERELERAASSLPQHSSIREEQRELLQAVAEDLKITVQRLARGLAPRLDPILADMSLLRHLSRL